MHASLAVPVDPPAPPPCPREAALALILGAAERPVHAVWHCRAFYADQARRFTGRRALDEAKRDLYHELATNGSEIRGSCGGAGPC